MKRIFSVILMATLIVSGSSSVWAKSHTRKMTGKVIDYSPKDCTDYIKTKDGNVWVITEADFEIGEKVIVRFDTRGTKKVQDDRIIRVRLQK